MTVLRHIEVMVHGVTLQRVEIHRPAQPVNPSDLIGSHTAEHLLPVKEDPVSFVTVQQHLIAHNALVVKKEHITVIALGAKGIVESVRQGLG